MSFPRGTNRQLNDKEADRVPPDWRTNSSWKEAGRGQFLPKDWDKPLRRPNTQSSNPSAGNYSEN